MIRRYWESDDFVESQASAGDGTIKPAHDARRVARATISAVATVNFGESAIIVDHRLFISAAHFAHADDFVGIAKAAPELVFRSGTAETKKGRERNQSEQREGISHIVL